VLSARRNQTTVAFVDSFTHGRLNGGATRESTGVQLFRWQISPVGRRRRNDRDGHPAQQRAPRSNAAVPTHGGRRPVRPHHRTNRRQIVPRFCPRPSGVPRGGEGKKGKGSPYSIVERRVPELIPRFLAVSLQVTRVVTHYFPPGLQLPPQSLRGLLPISPLGEQRHDVCEQFA